VTIYISPATLHQQYRQTSPFREAQVATLPTPSESIVIPTKAEADSPFALFQQGDDLHLSGALPPAHQTLQQNRQ
jgi:hypothetical protein